jgi:hypothetical protein
MPELPSGLSLYISRDALFDHGGNWFNCPDGHFWYWVAAPEMGQPPFGLYDEVMQAAEHERVPRKREEMKKFIRVLVKRTDGKVTWTGEWLADFPRYMSLDERDQAAWRAWLAEPKVDKFLDDAIAECERLAEICRHATGYAVHQDGKEGQTKEGRVLTVAPDATERPGARMHNIEMQKPSEEFERAWHAAGQHISNHAQGDLKSWLKVDLNPPFLEHLSFRLGNQLFFIRIEDIEGQTHGPGNPQGLFVIADGCKGHPCIMPMRKSGPQWIPDAPGWGLVDARTGRLVDPPALITQERVEMTNWELQDFAVQVVRDALLKQGRQLMSWQGNPDVDPSLWFVGNDGPEWVVIRAVRYPELEAALPANMGQVAERCSTMGKQGHFASVSFANMDDPFLPEVGGMPLWRGHGCRIRYEGLVPWAKN